MARAFFTLVALLGAFHTLAAPLRPRAELSGQRASLIDTGSIDSARNFLGFINTGPDFPNALFILGAQLSLLDARNNATQIADSQLQGTPPAPANSTALIVSGIQAALAQLSHVALEDNVATLTALNAENASPTTALGSARQAVAANCQTTAN